MYKLLLTGAFGWTEEQLEWIRTLGYEIFFLQKESDLLPVAAGDIECVVCNGLFLYHDIDNFTSLKFIQLTSAGLDRVPLEKINERGIELYNARGVYNVPMAEWVLFRVLEHYKRADHFRETQRSGKWIKERGLLEICGRKVAIVGAGNIGQTVAKHFAGFDVRVTGFDVHRDATPYFDEMDLTGNLAGRIAEFDIVVLTAPLTDETRHMISRPLVERMKIGAMLINIARGGLIDELAMIEVLRSRSDLHFALDVFEYEPLAADSPLWTLPNVSLSPHNSFVSDGNPGRLFKVIYDNLKNFAERAQ